MSSAPRKQAPRLPRPAARYWKGKAPKGVDADADSDSEGEQEEVVEGGAEMIGGEDYEGESGDEEEDDLKVGQLVGKQKAMNIALKDVNISREGKVIVAGREESGRTAIETLQNEESDESEEESDEGDAKPEQEESSEEETSSEDDEPPKPQFRPVFVPKRARATIAERELLAEDTEEAIKRKEEELEERRKQSHDLVAESIKRELAEKEKEEDIPDVDDTDGLDPEVEFETWRLRELARIKRDQEAALEREREREEVERRRAMPEEQRLKEDLEHAKKSRDDKPKGQQKFLQKYWHKGAFHQDEEILTRHDFTEATESTVDISLLPKVMQVKNFGKRSRTKYTHLLDQDTTTTTGGFGGTAPVKSGNKSLEGSGCFNCGGPHLKKDCPQMPANGGPGTSRPGPGMKEDGKRQWGGPPPQPNSGSWKDRDRDNGYNRDGRRDDYRRDYRRRSRSPSGGRSRSRSPRGERRQDRGAYGDRNRNRDDPHQEKDKKRDRSPRRDSHKSERRRSRSLEDDYRDKRRRVD